MILNYVKQYVTPLNKFIKFLRDSSFDIKAFIETTPLWLQFQIINHWAAAKENHSVLITPTSYILYHFKQHPFDKTLNEYVLEREYEAISDTVYKLAIIDLFKTINDVYTKDSNESTNETPF